MTDTPSTKEVGTNGEMIAAKELERLGLRIVRRNYRCPFGEMDIIAEEATPDGTILAFVEVKTRRGKAHGTPKEAVNARKQAKLYQIAQAYFAERDAGGEEPACRFDIMEVVWTPDGFAKATFHRAAFLAT
jgi:putative endonuclease